MSSCRCRWTACETQKFTPQQGNATNFEAIYHRELVFLRIAVDHIFDIYGLLHQMLCRTHAKF